jgi:hypothetical protein
MAEESVSEPIDKFKFSSLLTNLSKLGNYILE